MTILKLANLGHVHGGRILIGKSKTLGPIIAIGFPSVFAILMVAGFVRTGFSIRSFLMHGLLVTTIVPGTIALAYWCKLFARPAFHALRQREAISSELGQISIYGHRYPISDGASLQYDQSTVKLIDHGTVVTKVPGYFIKIVA